MCYSALVRKDIKKLSSEFGASIDTEAFVDLFSMRVQNPSLKIPEGLEEFFTKEDSSASRSIQKSIKAFEQSEEKRRSQELKDLEAEIKEIEDKLKIKVTKTNEKALGVKSRKRERLLSQAKRAASVSQGKANYRIYPNYFAPVITILGDKKIITPMRYRILPSSGVEIPSKYNVFNARRDSLMKARTWKATFGKHHAIFPFERFFEWVEQKGKKVEISFSPDGFDGMWAASLFEEYKSPQGELIRSFAMVTDEPPPEVAEAGHDRCPVFLESAYIDQWLSPQSVTPTELEGLLDHKQQTYYSHAIAA